jgi:acetolactate decarboxylase
MRNQIVLSFFTFIAIFSCDSNKKVSGDIINDASDDVVTEVLNDTPNRVYVSGAMKDAMWKGEIQGKISFDTIQKREGLYGLGPMTGMRGEILIVDGKIYLSQVVSETKMRVIKADTGSAPFFVYTHISNWQKTPMSPDVTNILSLEKHIDSLSQEMPRPFGFKLTGRVKSALIHVQNLPPGTKVSSPQEAHQGQIKYALENVEVEIVGFFSTEHKGIFTHHDSFMHMHLITEDKEMMGHLDEVNFGEMTLFLPAEK